MQHNVISKFWSCSCFFSIKIKKKTLHVQYLQGNICKVEFRQEFKIKIRKHLYAVHKDTHFRSKDS